MNINDLLSHYETAFTHNPFYSHTVMYFRDCGLPETPAPTFKEACQPRWRAEGQAHHLVFPCILMIIIHIFKHFIYFIY